MSSIYVGLRRGRRTPFLFTTTSWQSAAGPVISTEHPSAVRILWAVSIVIERSPLRKRTMIPRSTVEYTASSLALTLAARMTPRIASARVWFIVLSLYPTGIVLSNDHLPSSRPERPLIVSDMTADLFHRGRAPT